MKEWQFNILFFVGVGGAVFLLIAPEIGLHIGENPTALAGVGSILTYVLTQKKAITSRTKKKPQNSSPEEKEADE